MTRPHHSAALACLLVAQRSAASAQAAPVDIIELAYGATNVSAVTGHGRLTAGISERGDLSVLSWPSPSYADQLLYLSGNDPDARSRPQFGAHEGMGSFIGFWVKHHGQSELTFLRDPSWTVRQAYTRPDSVVPVTHFEHETLGLTVELTDVIAPDADVLSREVRVRRAQGSPVNAASLVVYENLSPTLSKVPELPVADWALDYRNDYAALFDDSARAIVHFSPLGSHTLTNLLSLYGDPLNTDYGLAGALMRDAAPSAEAVRLLLAGLELAYAPGVAALVATSPAASQFQVGLDATPFCTSMGRFADNIAALPTRYPREALPIDAASADGLRCTDLLPALRQRSGWRWSPEDALSDLRDGALSGSRIAAGQTNGALLTPLSFVANEAEASVHFAFGPTLRDARRALTRAQALGPDARIARAEAVTRALFARARLPAPELGAKVREVALRALLNLYVSRDAGSGAIMASVSRQPPYSLDWPRDGAFFTAALDVAGLTRWASQRLLWYTDKARLFPVLFDQLAPPAPTDPSLGLALYPADALEMNYFADGATGGPIRFEIDNTALHLWSVGFHAAQLEEPERAAFSRRSWQSARRAAELLTRWREAGTGLQAAAQEDDSFLLTSTLHGAVTVLAGLEQAVRLADYLGQRSDAARYRTRSAELRAAIQRYYADDPSGRLRRTRGEAPPARDGAVAWAVWPARLFARDDPRLEAQLTGDLATLLRQLRGEGPGIYYAPKTILSAALYGAPSGARAQAREALLLLADIATPGTLHFGEGYLPTRDAGRLVWSNRVATPHVWEGVLFYLAAMALTDPALLAQE